MKILFVCENYIPHYGGAEVVFKNLAERLVKKGHEVTLVTHQLKNTPRYEVMNGVKVHRVPCFDNRYLFSFFAVPKVLKLAKDSDVIQTTTFNGAGPAWLAGKIRKKPVVLTVHEIWVGKWRQLTAKGALSSFLHNLLEKAIYTLSYDKYVCVSDATRKALGKAIGKPDKSITIHNGFDYKFWKKKFNRKRVRKELNLEKNFVIFSWGRPGPAKGHEYVLRAMPEIKKKLPNAKCVMMLSNRQNYKKRQKLFNTIIKAHHLQDDVLFLDSVKYEELGDYIKAADCIALPSLSEGFGYAVLEACELGIPVVGTNNASIPEVIWGKYVLVPPRDPEAIAKAVVKISRKQYQKSQKRVFEWKDSVKAYLDVYKKLVHKL